MTRDAITVRLMAMPTFALLAALAGPAQPARADILATPELEIVEELPPDEELEAISNEEQPGEGASSGDAAEEPDAGDVSDDAEDSLADDAEVADEVSADAAAEKDAAPRAKEQDDPAASFEGEASQARILPLRLVAAVMAVALVATLAILRLRKRDRS